MYAVYFIARCKSYSRQPKVSIRTPSPWFWAVQALDLPQGHASSTP